VKSAARLEETWIDDPAIASLNADTRRFPVYCTKQVLITPSTLSSTAARLKDEPSRPGGAAIGY
jgi:hypothetical protein